MHKSQLGCLIIDCQTDDLDREAEFWSEALGHKIFRRYEPGDENYRALGTDPSQPLMLLQKVNHASRNHLDIETDNIEAEVKRLEQLGAKKIEEVRGWCVMQAPSGHRFCLVKNKREDFEDKANIWGS